MSNYHNNPPPLFGLSNAAFLQRESADDQPVDFGLYNGLYGGPDHPLIARHDPQGRVTGWTPILRLQPWQYVACPPISNGPQLGDPYELGVQPDAVGGCGIFFGPWDRVANRICHEAFAAVSQGMPQHPLEGRVEGYITEAVHGALGRLARAQGLTDRAALEQILTESLTRKTARAN
jgi:hypothetical protein